MEENAKDYPDHYILSPPARDISDLERMQPGREYWDGSPTGGLATTCTSQYLESRGYKARKPPRNQRSEVIPAVRSGQQNAAAFDGESELETTTALNDEPEQEASAAIPADGSNEQASILPIDFSTYDSV